MLFKYNQKPIAFCSNYIDKDQYYAKNSDTC